MPYKKPKHNRQKKKAQAAALAVRESRTIGQFIWCWNVVAGAALFLLATGVAFMLSNHAWAADLFFLTGGALITVKFLTWELTTQHPSRVFVSCIALVVALIVTGSSIGGNHYLNKRAFAHTESTQT